MKFTNVPVAKGQDYEITIHGLGSSGEGVGRYEGFTVFVPFALPEEVVIARITLVKKNYAVGELVTVKVPSPHRITPRCEVYERCGGCQLQHVSYEEQLRLKTQKVKDVVERIGKQDPSVVQPAIGPKEPWYYRNKMQMPVGLVKGKVAMGFYERGSHAIVDCQSCYIQKDENNQLAALCKALIEETKTPIYNEKTGQGALRHIIGRIGGSKGSESPQWMLILVSATTSLPQEELWIERLTSAFPNLESIVLNHNPKQTNVIMGAKNRVLYGEASIIDYIQDDAFQLSPQSFFQVNPQQTSVLYQTALDFADLRGHETVIDAYCGTGTISLWLAKKAKRVIGIEIVAPAIEDAKKNAVRNGYTNAEFIVGDAAVEMPKLYKQGLRSEVILMDPIRAGCKEEVLHAAAGMEPEKIVYVSCNPASMARDVAILTDLGYTLKSVQPVDMFPQTNHCEAVALLTRSE